MSAPRALLDVADLERRRSDDVRAARRLDDRGRRLRPGAVGVGIVVALAWWWFGLDSAPVAVVFGLMTPLVMRPWELDETGGAALRRVVGLNRRSVVAARYAALLEALALFVLGTLVVVACVVLIAGRNADGVLTSTWVAAGTGVVATCVGIPTRIRYGTGVAWFLVIVTAFTAMVALLAIATLVASFLGLWGRALLGLAVLAVLMVGGGVPSYRRSVRLYTRKDL